jgi:hypothetical protein
LIVFARESPRSVVCFARQRFYLLALADRVIFLVWDAIQSESHPFVIGHWMGERITPTA